MSFNFLSWPWHKEFKDIIEPKLKDKTGSFYVALLNLFTGEYNLTSPPPPYGGGGEEFSLGKRIKKKKKKEKKKKKKRRKEKKRKIKK